MKKLIIVAALLCVALCTTVHAQERDSTVSGSVIVAFDKQFGFEQPGIGGAVDATIQLPKGFATVVHADLLREKKAFASSGTTFSLDAGLRYYVCSYGFAYAGLNYGGWSSEHLSKRATRFEAGGGLSTVNGDTTLTIAALLPLSDPNSLRGINLHAEKFFHRENAWYGLRLAGNATFGTANRLPISPDRIFVRGSSLSVGLVVNISALMGQ